MSEQTVREIMDLAEIWFSEVTGLQRSFLYDMGNDQDWLMLMKCHALLETCINHVLTLRFGEPAAAKVFSRIEMSNPKTGKMAFVAAFDLLPKEMRSFIQKLSEMRNYAVHDIRNFNFTFDSYLESIDQKDRSAWKRIIMFSSDEDIGIKRAVQMGCINVLIQGFGSVLQTEFDRRVKAGLIPPGESTPRE